MSLSQLSRLPYAELVVAIKLSPLDPASRTSVDFYLTNRWRLVTTAADSPPLQPYRSVLLGEPTFDSRLTAANTFTGRSVSAVGEIKASIYGATDHDQPLRGWRDLEWEGHPAEIRVGATQKADGSPFPFSDFVSLGPLFMDGVAVDDQNIMTIRFADSRLSCEVPEVDATYLGLGGRLYVPRETHDTKAYSTNLPEWTVSGALTIDYFGGVDALPATSGALARCGEGAGDFNFGLLVNNAGEVGLRIGASSSTIWSSGLGLQPGKGYRVAGSVSASGFGKLYVSRYGNALELAASGQLEIPVASTAGSFQLGLETSTAGADVFVDELRMWSRELSYSELVARWLSLSMSLETDLEILLKFGDGTGDRAYRTDAPTLYLQLSNSSYEWRSSLEGDDPEQFSGSIRGQSKQRVSGAPFNVELLVLDSQRHDYGPSDGALSDVRVVRSDGLPIYPHEQIVAATGSDLTVDGSTSEVIATVASGLSFHRLVPAQSDPDLLGQAVDISSSTSWDGAYTVGAVSADGLRITLLDPSGSPVSLSPGSMPSGTTIESATTHRDYTLDLPRGVVRTQSAAAGRLTCDPVGVAGKLTASTAFAQLVSPAAVDNQLSWDPEVAWVHLRGEQKLVCERLDEIAQSAFGWYTVDPATGDYVLANYVSPGGVDPAALILDERLGRLSLSVTTDVVGRVLSCVEIPSARPAGRASVEFRRNYFPLESVGAVTDSDRERLSEPSRLEPATLSEDPPPAGSPDLGNIPSLLQKDADAREWLARAKTFIGRRSRWFEVECIGINFSDVREGEEVILQYNGDDPILRAGASAVVTRRRGGIAAGSIKLVVYLF